MLYPVPLSTSLQVDNPYTGEIFCEVAYDSKADAHAKVDAAVKAQLDWKNVPLHERQDLCTKWMAALASNAESIADEISGMMGKPVQQARNEVNGTIERAKYVNSSAQDRWLMLADAFYGTFLRCCRALIYLSDEALRTDSFPEENGLFRQITHDPVGVVYVIVSLPGACSCAVGDIY